MVEKIINWLDGLKPIQQDAVVIGSLFLMLVIGGIGTQFATGCFLG